MRRLRRRRDWPRRLDHAVELAGRRVFRWGRWDCALFAADCVQAMTGHDFAAAFRGRYGSEIEALRLAGGSLEDLADRLLGRGTANVARARRGDVVLVDTDRGPALAVVALDGMHVWCAAPAGLCRLPLADARKAWRIA